MKICEGCEVERSLDEFEGDSPRCNSCLEQEKALLAEGDSYRRGYDDGYWRALADISQRRGCSIPDLLAPKENLP